jgi:DNA mismatch repair ATPase MutS
VELGPAGSFLLVTGSNMSGKSTLLRAIGVNACLAQAGAPVCAERFVMPPLVVTTSIRARDSLEDGVSFYMAELRRLKEVVEQARGAATLNGRRLVYLLDEILLGTNSRERHIAAVRVLAHLLRYDAIGAISTHDLDLATSEPLQAACRCVHFRETLYDDADKPMTFDYKLRPGLAPTTNALKLLEIVGLHDNY